MIKTLPKLFAILENLDTIRWTPLARITFLSGQPKPSLCHLLKTMENMGYVENNGKGAYRLSEKFCSITGKTLAGQREQDAAFAMFRQHPEKVFPEKLSMQVCVDLAEKTRESAVVGVLSGKKISIVAQARFPQTFMIDLSIYRDLTLFHSTTGRAILANLCENELDKIISSHGLPGRQWDNISSKKALKKVLETLRKEKLVIMENHKEAFTAFSLPFFDKEGILCGSIGMTVPHARLKNCRSFIEKELFAAADFLTKENQKKHVSYLQWKEL